MRSASGDDVVSAPQWDFTVGGLGSSTVPIFREVAHLSHPETTRTFDNPQALTQYAIKKGKMLPSKRQIKRMQRSGNRDPYWPTMLEVDVYKGLFEGSGDGLIPVPKLCILPIPDDNLEALPEQGLDMSKALLAAVKRDPKHEHESYRLPGVSRKYVPDVTFTAFDSEGNQFLGEAKSAEYFTRRGRRGKDPSKYVEKILALKRAYPFFRLVLFSDVSEEELRKIWDAEGIKYGIRDVYDEYCQVSDGGAMNARDGREQQRKAEEFMRGLRQRPGIFVAKDINELVVRMQRVWTTVLIIEFSNRLSEGRRVPGMPDPVASAPAQRRPEVPEHSGLGRMAGIHKTRCR